jgi:hypothetical protein
VRKENASDWRKGTKRNLIAELAERGSTKREAYAALRSLVESQTKPMVFSANVGGSRTPKPIGEQLVELKNEIGRVYALLGRAKDSRFESEEIPSDEIQNEEIEAQEEQEEESTETATEKELNYFLRRIREIRAFCRDRATSGDPIDNISMRPAQAAAKLIPAGIPADTLILAMTMHWSPDTRRDAGIDSFDFNSRGQSESCPAFLKVSREVMRSRKISGEGKHELFGYLLLLIENGINTMLIGPAGTGKSHIAEQVAAHMNLPYGETGMSAGASRGDLLGRHTISQEKPWITSEYTAIYSGGGIFNFEEIDRADPGVLVALNNSLAGNTLYNSIDGERYPRHETFTPISTANTFGLGANRNYTSAERLDAATIDRFRMGRLFIPLDEAVEEDILFGRL